MTGLFAPRAVWSVTVEYASLHLAQDIGAMVAPTVFCEAARSSNCWRNLGEAAIPSSFAGLNCAWATPAAPANRARPMVIPVSRASILFLVVFILELSFFLLFREFLLALLIRALGRTSLDCLLSKAHQILLSHAALVAYQGSERGLTKILRDLGAEGVIIME